MSKMPELADGKAPTEVISLDDLEFAGLGIFCPQTESYKG
jgi:hypothetical protein